MMSMLGVGRRVLNEFNYYTIFREVFHDGSKTDMRHNIQRKLCLTSRRCSKTQHPSETHLGKPIKFSTSKASHRTWNVDLSMGSSYQRPWWKVLPVSVFGLGLMMWCMFENSILQREEKPHEEVRDLLLDNYKRKAKTVL